MARPEKGDDAPAFTLMNAAGKAVTLAGLKGKHVIIYFYPKDDTPGCTVEAKGFSNLLKEYRKANAVVYGVSRDSQESHAAFAEKCGLSVPLLSDPDGSVIKRYGCLVRRTMFGRSYLGVQRATFLINPKGKIARVWPRVTPEEHAEEVLAAVNASAGGR